MADLIVSPTPAAASQPLPGKPLREQLERLQSELYQLSAVLTHAWEKLDTEPSDPDAYPSHTPATDMVAVAARDAGRVAECLDLIALGVRS